MITLTNSSNQVLDPEKAKATHTKFCTDLYKGLKEKLKTAGGVPILAFHKYLKQTTVDFYKLAVEHDNIYVPPRSVVTLIIVYLIDEPYVEVVVQNEDLGFKLELVK